MILAMYFLSVFCNKLSVFSSHKPCTPTVIVLNLQSCFAISGYNKFVCSRQAHQLMNRGKGRPWYFSQQRTRNCFLQEHHYLHTWFCTNVCTIMGLLSLRLTGQSCLVCDTTLKVVLWIESRAPFQQHEIWSCQFISLLLATYNQRLALMAVTHTCQANATL